MTKLKTAILATFALLLFSVAAVAHDWGPYHHHGWNYGHPRVILRFAIPSPPIHNYIEPSVRYRESPAVRRELDGIHQDIGDLRRENDQQNLVIGNGQDRLRSLEEVENAPRRNGRVMSTTSFGTILGEVRDGIAGIPAWMIFLALLVLFGYSVMGWLSRKKRFPPTPELGTMRVKSVDSEPSFQPAPPVRPDPVIGSAPAGLTVKTVKVRDRSGKEHSVEFEIGPNAPDGSPQYVNPLTGKLVGEKHLPEHAKRYLAEKQKVEF